MILFLNSKQEDFEVELALLSANFPDKVKFDDKISGNEEVIVVTTIEDSRKAAEAHPASRILLLSDDVFSIDPRQAMALAHEGVQSIVDRNDMNQLTDAIALSYSKKKNLAGYISREVAPPLSTKDNYVQAGNFKNKHIVGDSLEIRKAIKIMSVLSTNYQEDLLVTGENGSGKGVMVSALLDNCKRKNVVSLNVAEYQGPLFASRFFGYKKGAFTGADKDTDGILARGNKGIIFLDEIGELEMADQAKLLRVLQEREYTVIGDTKPNKLDVQFIFATNRPLLKMVQEGTFREDLFHRINQLNIEIPPLRERRNDIPQLIDAFIAKLNARYKDNAKGIDEGAVNLLTKGPWPGNVRQLESVIRNLFVREETQEISLKTTVDYLTYTNDLKGPMIDEFKYEPEAKKVAHANTLSV